MVEEDDCVSCFDWNSFLTIFHPISHIIYVYIVHSHQFVDLSSFYIFVPTHSENVRLIELVIAGCVLITSKSGFGILSRC